MFTQRPKLGGGFGIGPTLTATGSVLASTPGASDSSIPSPARWVSVVMALGGDALVQAIPGDVRVVERVEQDRHQHERRRPARPEPPEVGFKMRLLAVLPAPRRANSGSGVMAPAGTWHGDNAGTGWCGTQWREA